MIRIIADEPCRTVIFKTIPIIAMTANAFREDKEKCLAAGMNAHLAKPIKIENIKRILCEYCV